MSENISVSEERLRLILAEFKLELFEKLNAQFATKADASAVEALRLSVKALEVKVAEHDNIKERVMPQFENMQVDVEALKDAASDARAVSRYKKAVIAGGVALVGALGGVLGYGIQSVIG